MIKRHAAFILDVRSLKWASRLSSTDFSLCAFYWGSVQMEAQIKTQRKNKDLKKTAQTVHRFAQDEKSVLLITRQEL